MRSLRPAEPEDLSAVHALFGDLPWEIEPDDALAASIARYDGSAHRMVGTWDGAVVAYGRLAVSSRLRIRHLGVLDLAAVDVDAATAFVDAFCDLAFRWMGLLRVDVTWRDGHPLADALRATGFTPWVRRPRAWRRQGVTRDLLTWGRLRADLPPLDTPPRVVARPTGPRPSRVTVRPTTPADAAAIATRMSTPTVLWGTHQVGTVPAAYWRQRLQPAGFAGSLVVEVDGHVVGNGGIQPNGGDRAHCVSLGISIAPEAQGLGAGDRLMGALVDLARDLGFDRIELDVYADNQRAEALYRKHGFADDGTSPYGAWRDGAWATDRAMSRPLR